MSRALIRLLLAGAVAASTAFSIQCRRRVKLVTPVPWQARKLRLFCAAIRCYTFYGTRMEPPVSLRQLVDTRWLEEDDLTHAAIPVVPGSDPPTSYHYVPCGREAPGDRIIVYPNARANRRFMGGVYVLRRDMCIEELSAEEYEKQVRALGEDYRKLPEMNFDEIPSTRTTRVERSFGCTGARFR